MLGPLHCRLSFTLLYQHMGAVLVKDILVQACAISLTKTAIPQGLCSAHILGGLSDARGVTTFGQSSHFNNLTFFAQHDR